MPGTMTLADLHDAIQRAMGWHDRHLHVFEIGGEQFGDRSVIDDATNKNSVTLHAGATIGMAIFSHALHRAACHHQPCRRQQSVA